MTGVRLLRRGLKEWKAASNLSSVATPGLEAIVEQCWRNFLDVFGKARLLPPRQPPTVGYYQGAFFLASAARLREHSRATYARAHALAAGGDGRCHHGELDWSRLSFERTAYSGAVIDSPRLSKHTAAGAWEHLEHVIVGSMGLRAPFYFDWCTHFEYSGDCPGSPCHKRRKPKLLNSSTALPKQLVPKGVNKGAVARRGQRSSALAATAHARAAFNRSRLHPLVNRSKLHGSAANRTRPAAGGRMHSAGRAASRSEARSAGVKEQGLLRTRHAWRENATGPASRRTTRIV